MATVTLGSMEEGSIIKLNEDSALVEFYVAKQNYESELNGAGWVLVVRKDCYDERQWHSEETPYTICNDYSTSDIDIWLNGTYKNLLDAGIRAAMGTTKIYCAIPNNSGLPIPIERSVFLLSLAELGGSEIYAETEGKALSSAVIDLLKIENESIVCPWTRTPRRQSAYGAWRMYPGGKFTVESCLAIYGSQPSFTLPAFISVRNDGFVSGGIAPNIPSSITVPGEVLGGTSLTVMWGAAADPEDDLAGYELEHQVDGGDWVQIYKGADTSYTDAITRGWLTVSYRVRAYDSFGLYSDYTVSPTQEVNNNRAPAITCAPASGANLGVKNEDFTIGYSIGDADGDPVTITEAIDGGSLRTFTPGAGEACTFAVTGETFMKLLNGAHELTITASDGQAETVHRLAFTKSVTAASITLETPMEADGKITLCVLSITGSIPEDAPYRVRVTNNALDAAPVWEDCTDEVKIGANHVFANETAVNGFAFNFKVEVERGESGEGGYINSVQGGFQ